MCKPITLALLILASSIRAAVPSISLPLDWTGAAGISRANLNLNPIALRDGANVAIDSLNPILSVLTGYSNSLALASNQDLILKVDADANGTNRLVVTGNNIDSLFRVNEDGTARLFNSLTLDSSLTIGKRLYLTDSLKLTLLTASSPVLALDATKHVIPGTTTGSGSTVVLGTSPTIASPTVTGTLAGAAATFSGKVVGSDTIRSVAPLVSQSNIFATGSNLGYWINTPGTFTYGMYQTGTSLAFRSGSTSPWLTVDASGLPTFANAVSMSSTAAVTGKLTGSDTVAAVLGFRAGNTAASNTILYRSGADMWTTPDSLTVANLRVNGGSGDIYLGSDQSVRLYRGSTNWLYTDDSVNIVGRAVVSGRLDVGDSVLGASARFTGSVRADTIICPKCYEEDSFTMTLRGCASDPTGTAKYIRIGKNVTLTIPYLTCTSDSSGAAMTGLPAAIQPPNDQYIGRPFRENDTIVSETGNNSAFIVSGSAIRFYLAGSYTTFFAASSTRSNMPNSTPGTNFIITYTLQ